VAGPLGVLKEAVRAVPVVKYALGVAGLAAVVAIATKGFGLEPSTAFIGTVVVLGLMVPLLLLAAAAKQNKKLLLPAEMFVWALMLMTVGALALLLLAFFWQYPAPVRCLVYGQGCQDRMANSDPAKNRETCLALGPVLKETPVEQRQEACRAFAVAFHKTASCGIPCNNVAQSFENIAFALEAQKSECAKGPAFSQACNERSANIIMMVHNALNAEAFLGQPHRL
jgi:hypothetical protein